MAKLAIRGHETRGKEVIEILQMLGGKKTIELYGNATGALYSIFNDRRIDYFNEYRYNKNEHEIFTLEEFLEKFPYKVGDKVIAPASHNIHTVESMHWDGNQIYYNTVGEGFNTSYTSKELQPYKEEIMKEKLEQITLDIPDGYEFFGINDDNKVVLTKKYIQYPKTYEECVTYLGLGVLSELSELRYDIEYLYKKDLIITFQKLLICRNAYWKIAGEQMGLGKSWKPDWKEKRYIIYRNQDDIVGGYREAGYVEHYIFEFPTKEMRDAFKENFKSLIGKCKELL